MIKTKHLKSLGFAKVLTGEGQIWYSQEYKTFVVYGLESKPESDGEWVLTFDGDKAHWTDLLIGVAQNLLSVIVDIDSVMCPHPIAK